MTLTRFTMQKNTKTQTLKDTEINLKKTTLHGSYNIYKKTQKRKINKPQDKTHTKHKKKKVTVLTKIDALKVFPFRRIHKKRTR